MFLMLFREEICIGKQFSHHSSDPSLLEQFELSLVNVSFAYEITSLPSFSYSNAKS